MCDSQEENLLICQESSQKVKLCNCESNILATVIHYFSILALSCKVKGQGNVSSTHPELDINSHQTTHQHVIGMKLEGHVHG